MGKYPNRGVIDAYAGREPRRRAVDGAVEPPAWRPTSSRLAVGPDPLRGARAAAGRCASPSTPTTCVPVASSGPSPASSRPRSSTTSSTAAATGCASTPTSSATTRSAPRPAGSRSTASAHELDDDARGVHPRPLVGRALHGGRAGRRRGGRSPAAERVDDRHLVADALRAARRHPLRAPPLLPAPRVRRLAAGGAAGRHRAPRRPPRAVRRARARRRRCATTTAGCSAPCSTARWPTDRRGRSRSRRWATPASTSAPASTSGFDGHWHGEWRGDLHVDGEHIADCTDVETGPPHPPVPRLPRAGRRPGRRRHRLRQPAEPRRRRRTPRSGLTEEASFM